ncbi:MAG: glycosyltransferase family 2 protein [Bacteroidaceae bacterium]|nr:glycosyltransferase family 2 protein [Bacteroidaceae bacterium]MBQ6752133.1 glycosyltransferase family 2 protein [Bacteroidaceae bacterium]
MNKKMIVADDTTLVITTYNNPPFLELVLKGVLRQQVMPCEVIIADDGSTSETKELIERYKKCFPVPLIHSWIPDEGFRAAKSRNVAISKAHGEYIITIDGDIVISPSFVKDHVAAREPGYFINGSRSRLMEKATRKRCASLDPRFSVFTIGLKRPMNLLRIPWLHRLVKGAKGIDKIRGCNMSFWKADIVAVNGFEERFVGWGCEDTELVDRFYNIGLKRKNIKGLAPCVHLYHPKAAVNYKTHKANIPIREETERLHKTRADKGLDQYLSSSSS